MFFYQDDKFFSLNVKYMMFNISKTKFFFHFFIHLFLFKMIFSNKFFYNTLSELLSESFRY